MSTHVYGFKPPDEKWKRMKAVWDACDEAGVPLPPEVEKFFGGETPDDAGVEVQQNDLEKCGAVRKYSEDMYDGFELDVSKLPPDIAIIRFVNSY